MRNFASRPALADEAPGMEAQRELAVNMNLSSPARESRHNTPGQRVTCRCSPQLRNVWETLVTLFLRCCKEDLFCK